MAKPLRKTSNLLESLCKESERGEREAWRVERSRGRGESWRRERGRAGAGFKDRKTEGEERLNMA